MAQSHGAVELPTITGTDDETSRPQMQSSNVVLDQSINLPPTDRGLAAWRLLLAAFVFEALLWGFPLSFGVFQDYYSRLEEFKDSRYTSVIGTTASGISYLGAPLILPFIRRRPNQRTLMVAIGWPLCIIGLIAGSFAANLGTLILTQGVIYGVGFIIFYYPILSMVDEYWIQRRGMAYGLLCSASGVSGAVMPLILQASLKRYGHRTTLRAIAVILVALTGPLIPLLKGRIRQQPNASPRTDWSFLKSQLFWVYSLSNLLMGLGYFFPSLYLPSYATAIGLSVTNGALLLTLMSVSQVAGQFTFGYLSDKKISINLLMTLSVSIAAVATFGSWGVARSMPPLIIFALLYGFFGAGYTAMWARMVTAVSPEPSSSQAMFGLFCFGKGIGNVLAGPIGSAFLRLSTSDSGYGHGIYKSVVVFTGVCLFLSAIVLVAKYFRFKCE